MMLLYCVYDMTNTHRRSGRLQERIMTDRIKRMVDLSNRVNIYPDTITPEFDRAEPGKHSN